MYVRDDDGVWRPRITEGFSPKAGDTGTSRVLDEQTAPDAGTKKFIMLQSDHQTPVTFDPCVPIDVEINYWNAPENGRALIEEAITEVESLTGLKFKVLGETDREVEFDRIFSGKQPVLISWTDRWQVPDLKGDVLGVAGAQPAVYEDWYWYISGQVALDGKDLKGMPDEMARSVIMHELGHLVGLDHVDSEEELMYPMAIGRTSFGSGDRSGLAELGAGKCIS